MAAAATAAKVAEDSAAAKVAEDSVVEKEVVMVEDSVVEKEVAKVVMVVVMVVDSAVVGEVDWGEVDSVAREEEAAKAVKKILHNFHPRIARLGKHTVRVDFVADIWMNEGGNTYLHQDRPDLRSKYLEWEVSSLPQCFGNIKRSSSTRRRSNS